MSQEFIPKWVAWETTQKCNLKCVHCRCSSELTSSEGDFDTDEGKALLKEIADFNLRYAQKMAEALGFEAGSVRASAEQMAALAASHPGLVQALDIAGAETLGADVELQRRHDHQNVPLTLPMRALTLEE